MLFFDPGRQNNLTVGQALRIYHLSFAVFCPLKKGPNRGLRWIDAVNDLMTCIKLDPAHYALSVGFFDLSHDGILKEIFALSPTPKMLTSADAPEVWKPVIAAINGYAVGLGCELALACDIRIAADDARIGLPEVKRAMVPGGGGAQRLPRLVPFGDALMMLLTGDWIEAPEAYRIGLVQKVVPRDQLLDEAFQKIIISRLLADPKDMNRLILLNPYLAVQAEIADKDTLIANNRKAVLKNYSQTLIGR